MRAAMPERVPDFVHLHNHTTYSLLDGAQRVDEMLARAADDGQTALAITDHGNLFGVLDFAKKAEKRGVRPIVGIEAYVAPGSRHERQAAPGKKPYFHLILLAESYAGYKNLIRLATAGYLEGFYYRPRIDKELLRQHAEGLVCLSACLAGEVPTLLRGDRYPEALRVAGEFRDLFGPERYWLELQDHYARLPRPGRLLVETFPRAGRQFCAIYAFAGRDRKSTRLNSSHRQ